MNPNDWKMQDLANLQEAARLLGASFGSRAALYARIRRGTLYAVRVGRCWYIPRVEIRRLQRQTARQSKKSMPALALDFPDAANQELLASVSVAKRGRAALEAQAFLRGTIRARLRRMYPDLSPREITFKYFEEVARNG